jgi:hypothetical protein
MWLGSLPAHKLLQAFPSLVKLWDMPAENAPKKDAISIDGRDDVLALFFGFVADGSPKASRPWVLGDN